MSISPLSSVKQFLGSEAETPYEQAQAVIIPIPYEATTTYRKGCEQGPDGVLTASDQLEAYDEELQYLALRCRYPPESRPRRRADVG
jgi:agmatinase